MLNLSILSVYSNNNLYSLFEYSLYTLKFDGNTFISGHLILA